jgi:hypothetical protein
MIAVLAAGAWAGELEGEVALDLLHATSTSEAPSSGPQPGLSATELGVRVRGEVEQGRLLAAVDYQGREPVAGLFPDNTFRLFYRAEVVGEVVEDRLSLGVGRFLAPSVLFLPVDGGRLLWTPAEHARVELFGGRRGYRGPRADLGFGPLLPAVGGAAAVGSERVQVDLKAAVAGDEVLLGTPDALVSEEYVGFSGSASAWGRPVDALRFGAAGTVAQRATYVLAASSSPAAVSSTVTIEAADLFQGLGWASWDASEEVRLDADVLRQQATIVAAAVEAEPPGDQQQLVDPTFTDLRVRGRVHVLDGGWVRPDVRLRLRGAPAPGEPNARTELRYGGGLEIDRLPVDGLSARGDLRVEDILGASADNVGAVDRLLWTAAGGWRGDTVDLEAGASFTDRALAPVSARSLQATTSDDLSPFVLEAQNVVFARGFWTNRTWFAGGDLEVSVLDTEIRGFVQVGVMTEAEW